MDFDYAEEDVADLEFAPPIDFNWAVKPEHSEDNKSLAHAFSRMDVTPAVSGNQAGKPTTARELSMSICDDGNTHTSDSDESSLATNAGQSRKMSVVSVTDSSNNSSRPSRATGNHISRKMSVVSVTDSSDSGDTSDESQPSDHAMVRSPSDPSIHHTGDGDHSILASPTYTPASKTKGKGKDVKGKGRAAKGKGREAKKESASATAAFSSAQHPPGVPSGSRLPYTRDSYAGIGGDPHGLEQPLRTIPGGHPVHAAQLVGTFTSQYQMVKTTTATGSPRLLEGIDRAPLMGALASYHNRIELLNDEQARLHFIAEEQLKILTQIDQLLDEVEKL